MPEVNDSDSNCNPTTNNSSVPDKPTPRVSGFSATMWAINYPTKSPYHFAVLVVLAYHVNRGTGDAFPRVELIAQMTAMSVAKVRRVIADLEADGVVEVNQPSRRARARYKLCFGRVYHNDGYPESGTAVDSECGTPVHSILTKEILTTEGSEESLARNTQSLRLVGADPDPALTAPGTNGGAA